MKKPLLFIFLFQFCALFAQEEWMILDLTDQLTDTAEEIHPIVNENTGDFVTFLKSDNELVFFLYNDTQTLQSTLKIESPHKNLKNFIGSAYDGQKFTLFFTDNSETTYSGLKLDFTTNSFDIIEDVNVSVKKERIISYLESGSKLHMLSVPKNSSTLIRRSFKADGTFNMATYDFSNETIENDNSLPLSFYSLLFGEKSDNPFQTINTNVPNSLEQTSAFTKIYLNKNTIQLTNNTYKKYSYLINLDVDSNTYKLNKIENKNFDKKNRKSNANSFILDHWFFDTYSTTEGITFNVYDTNTLELAKTFNIVPGDSIAFKNSPIIFDKGQSDSFRDLEKTTRFVRKVNSSNIGISAYPFGDQFILTLGASENVSDSNLMAVGVIFFGLVGAAIMSAFDNYGKTESVRIACIFDSNFDHVPGDIPQNGFDLINAFIKENDYNRADLQTVFRYKDHYIWGYYHEAGKFYRFYKFNSFEN